MQYTENYNLYKPVYGEPADVADLNHNADEIDELIHENRTMIAPTFDPDEPYSVGDPVEYQGGCYVFIADKAAGVWDASKVRRTTAAEIGGGGASAIADLTDVDVITPADGEILIYDSASGKWVNATLPTPTVPDELNDMSDVDITTPTDGQILVYDDTDDEWKNQDLPDASVTKTASGNPVEFTDGANAPLVKCVSAITGSQDLHGYDKPWVGGAGKNKLPCDYGTSTQSDITFTPNIDGTLKINGTSTATVYYPADYSTQAGIELPAGTYILSGRISGTRVYIHNTDTDTNYGYDTYMGEVTIDIPSGHYCFVVRVATNTTISNETVYPMLRLSNVTDSTFEPYSNICPITAYNQSTISVGNISKQSDYTLVDDYYINADGVITQNNVYKYCPEYIKVEPNKTYHVFMYKTVELQVGFTVPLYDKNKQFVSRVVAIPASSASEAGTKTGTFTTTNETAFIRFSCPKGSTDQTIGVKVSHTATFSQSIYQGNADFVGSKATATWGYIASYNGETLPGEWISSMDEYAPGTTPTTGAQVAYELASPTEETITPTNLPIKSLFGYNHIESSTGNMEVEYITKPYEPLIDATDISIEEHGKTIESIITENLETRMVASRNYTIGELIISGDKAYRSTANIASGAALTVNTNVVETTIEEEIGRSGHVYSTSEQVVGTWIDGSTLYEKTYTVASVQGPSSYVLEAGINNFEIIDFSGVFFDGVLRSIPSYATITTPVVLYKYNNNLYIQNSLNNAITNVVATIRYYKS